MANDNQPKCAWPPCQNRATKDSRYCDDCRGWAEHGASIHEAQVTDNPFSGFGRPFSNDNELMSEQYNQKNPAAATEPYAGDHSYSINTTAPYNPPQSGLQNPSQNVGPYNPPSGANQVDDDAPKLSAVYQQWNNEDGWYDGTTASIYHRITQAEHIKTAAQEQDDTVIEDLVNEQINVLTRVANEIDDSNLIDYLDELPGGTIAMEYDDLHDGGLIDTTSFLHTTAATLLNEVEKTDWNSLPTKGARQWVARKINDNPGLLNHEAVTREAAVDYVKNKTMVLLDPVHRANIIDEFVTNVERYRREAAKSIQDALEIEDKLEEQKEGVRQLEAKRQVDAAYTEYFLPGEYIDLENEFNEDGTINIGEDDGSAMYNDAKDVITTTASRDWGQFTTEGAKEWFYSKAADSYQMLKHEDTTRRAATDYAKSQSSLIRDAALRNEIVRAFTASIEALRDEYVNRFSKEASAHEETSDFDKIYSDEKEILW